VTAARIHAKQRAIAPGLVVWAGLLALLGAAVLGGTWAAVGQRPTPPMVFAPGSIAFIRSGDVHVAAADGASESLLYRAARRSRRSIGSRSHPARGPSPSAATAFRTPRPYISSPPTEGRCRFRSTLEGLSCRPRSTGRQTDNDS
jgi:hypothetical protein